MAGSYCCLAVLFGSHNYISIFKGLYSLSVDPFDELTSVRPVDIAQFCGRNHVASGAQWTTRQYTLVPPIAAG